MPLHPFLGIHSVIILCHLSKVLLHISHKLDVGGTRGACGAKRAQRWLRSRGLGIGIVF